MSIQISPGKNDINFESLYNNLKEEFDQNKKDNDEIFKEYESTIQLLTDSVESFKKEKKDLQSKLSKIENEQKIYKREKDNLIKKNKDKMIDIQCLNEQNDKLNELIKKLKEEKSMFDTKIVTLENDIDHYQNKIREYEDFIDELKSQLEDALEENITLQTEFETYKLTTGDQLIRKEEELRDIKSDITNKEKLIQKLTKKPSERFNIQKMQEKLINEKNLIGNRRRLTFAEKNPPKNSNFKKNLTYIQETENENNKDNNLDNKNIKTNIDLNTILERTNYRNNKKALTSCKTSQTYIDSFESNNNNNTNNKTNNNTSENKSERNITKILKYNESETKNNENKENEFIKEEKNINKSLNKNENKMNGLTTIIKKQFGELVICEGNKIYVNPLVRNLFSEEQIKEFTISLQSMLIRIQQRKNNLFNKKKAINEQLEKLNFRQ